MKRKILITPLVCLICTQFVFSQVKYEFTTILKEKFTDKSGSILTGKGVVVGDVDSGIDVFHPMFFFADGGEFTWVDVDNDEKLTFGTDGVDLNGDGKISANEILRYIEIRDNTYGMLGGNSKTYNPDLDFLYTDVNNNKRRDYGIKSGFKESDASYGEQLLILRDENKNGRADVGEKLSALKTSKVRAVRERNGNVRRRGTDLIETEEDSSGHGTGVAGLILGGHYGVQKNHGIAPDAEIIISSVDYDYTPRFVRDFPEIITFLREEKINILLFEDGEWMWEFMDGSSPEEQLTNQMARDGITIIGGAGNFTGAKMMIIDTLEAGETVLLEADAPSTSEQKKNDGVFYSILWRENSNLSFTVESPDKNKTTELSSGSGIEKSGAYNISYAKTSSNETNMFRLGCSKNDSGTVKGRWKINVKADKRTIIWAYVVDVSQSWGGTSHWVSGNISDESTMCFPSTADSCMAIGAYVVNFGWFDKIGDICSYSSKGYRIKGGLAVTLTAPGHSTFSCEKDNGWQIFSGTSSAAPHVVGTAALLLQYDNTLTHADIRQILINSASSDNFTGTLPNPTWGYGKLDKEAAVKFLMNNFKKNN